MSAVMSLDEALEGLYKRAEKNPALRRALLATRESRTPAADFCALAVKEGFPIAEMDLVGGAEEYYAAMRRSTNGGGENSPLLEGEDDYYEMFLAQLEQIRDNETGSGGVPQKGRDSHG